MLDRNHPEEQALAADVVGVRVDFDHPRAMSCHVAITFPEEDGGGWVVLLAVLDKRVVSGATGLSPNIVDALFRFTVQHGEELDEFSAKTVFPLLKGPCRNDEYSRFEMDDSPGAGVRVPLIGDN